MDGKIEQIEITLAHQDHQIQDLSEMISKQWTEIDRLRRELDRALAKLQAQESGASAGEDTDHLSVSEMAALEKPPHY
jgi:SlyX protein